MENERRRYTLFAKLAFFLLTIASEAHADDAFAQPPEDPPIARFFAYIWELLLRVAFLLIELVYAIFPNIPKPASDNEALGLVILTIAAILAVIGALLFISIAIANITLSRQTLTYKRNLLLIGFVVLIAQLFEELDIPASVLSVDMTPEQLTSIVDGGVGILGAFLLVQFLYNFYFDVIESTLKLRWSIILALPVASFRFIFDLLLPIASGIFVITTLAYPSFLFTQQSANYFGDLLSGYGQYLGDNDQIESAAQSLRDYGELDSPAVFVELSSIAARARASQMPPESTTDGEKGPGGRQACFDSCNASQRSTPESSGAYYGHRGGAPFYGGAPYYGGGFGNYCCDIYGNRRCGPERQSAQIGTPCTCAGQGNGHVCY
jgi:hypothetical protein